MTIALRKVETPRVESPGSLRIGVYKSVTKSHRHKARGGHKDARILKHIHIHIYRQVCTYIYICTYIFTYEQMDT